MIEVDQLYCDEMLRLRLVLDRSQIVVAQQLRRWRARFKKPDSSDYRGIVSERMEECESEELRSWRID